MRVAIDNSPISRKVSIYVMINNLLLLSDGKTWDEYEVGTIPPHPTFWMDSEVWEAILREAIGPTPNDGVLQDTIKVRDRLLTMVETEWQSRQLEKQ